MLKTKFNRSYVLALCFLKFPLRKSNLYCGKERTRFFLNVGNYRALNNIIQQDRYPLSYVTNFTDFFEGCTVYKKFNCYKGYHRILLNPEDDQKTAIITLVGLFEYISMPFGLRNSGNRISFQTTQLTKTAANHFFSKVRAIQTFLKPTNFKA